MNGFLEAKEFGPFMKMGAKALRLRAHEKSGQARFQEKQTNGRRRMKLDYCHAAERAELVIEDEYDELLKIGQEYARVGAQIAQMEQYILASS